MFQAKVQRHRCRWWSPSTTIFSNRIKSFRPNLWFIRAKLDFMCSLDVKLQQWFLFFYWKCMKKWQIFISVIDIVYCKAVNLNSHPFKAYSKMVLHLSTRLHGQNTESWCVIFPRDLPQCIGIDGIGTYLGKLQRWIQVEQLLKWVVGILAVKS